MSCPTSYSVSPCYASRQRPQIFTSPLIVFSGGLRANGHLHSLIGSGESLRDSHCLAPGGFHMHYIGASHRMSTIEEGQKLGGYRAGPGVLVLVGRANSLCPVQADLIKIEFLLTLLAPTTSPPSIMLLSAVVICILSSFLASSRVNRLPPNSRSRHPILMYLGDRTEAETRFFAVIFYYVYLIEHRRRRAFSNVHAVWQRTIP